VRHIIATIEYTVHVGLVTMASAAIFAQLEPTYHIPPAAVQEAEAG
jgi:hypothetical protein